MCKDSSVCAFIQFGFGVTLLHVSATFNDQNRPNFVVGTVMELCSNFNLIGITLLRKDDCVTTNTVPVCQMRYREVWHCY